MSKIVDEIAIGRFKENMDSELNKKQNKTFVETVENTTSVVTVPENVAGFAAVKMIGGKTVKSKNLIPFPYSYESGYKHRGIIFDYDETGMIHAYGTNDSESIDAYFFLKRKEDRYSATFPFVDKQIYTLSIELSGNCGTSTNTVMYLAENYTGKNKDLFSLTLGGSNPVINRTITYTKPTDAIIGHTLALRINRGDTVDFYIRPMLEEGSTATGYEPYFEGLHSAPVESVVSQGADGKDKTTLLLSELTKNLPDYGCSAGEVYNYIDFEEMKYHRNVISVDLKTINCVARENDFKITLPNVAKVNYAVISDLKYINVYTNAEHLVTDKSMRIASNGIDLTVRDSDYNYIDTGEIDRFKEYINDKTFVYELATPEVIDLSDILTPFAIETNGTIEFVNEHNLDVPNTVLYKKEVL